VRDEAYGQTERQTSLCINFMTLWKELLKMLEQ